MKALLYIVLVLVTVFAVGCGMNKTDVRVVELTNKPEGKVLVVYFSESPNKNTQTIAEWINEAIGGDIQRIEMVEPYTGGYREIVKQSGVEIKNNIHPEIKAFEKNIADYDIIFIGSPIWHNTYAPPVGTFLAANSFDGKTLVPFCTHGGGGAGNFYRDVKENAKGASTVKEGFTARGSNIIERHVGRGTKDKVSKNDVFKWLNEVFNAK